MTHPYQTRPDHCFWGRSVAHRSSEAIDPVVRGRFRIQRAEAIVTAGSCFAQHISRHLQDNGFHYLVTESGHPAFHPALMEGYNYGTFSARYGNIYTARQMLQLLHRAYGLWLPLEDAWEAGQGRVIDPFRPRIQPHGFVCREELAEDRAQHFAAVRRAIEEMSVLVFTLGLTEAWVDRRDEAVFPLCPGVAGGVFEPARHGFVNFRVADVTADLRAIVAFVRTRNPAARVLLTVSPVPLVATATVDSVVQATVYSKSVLRVAANEVAEGDEGVAYFPSYEIVTGAFARGAYFEADLRSVTPAGVARVMELFLRHYGDSESDAVPPTPVAGPTVTELQQISRAICEEEMLDHR